MHSHVLQTDEVLRRFETILVDIYMLYSAKSGKGVTRAQKLEYTLMGYDEWNELLRDLALIGQVDMGPSTRTGERHPSPNMLSAVRRSILCRT